MPKEPRQLAANLAALSPPTSPSSNRLPPPLTNIAHHGEDKSPFALLSETYTDRGAHAECLDRNMFLGHDLGFFSRHINLLFAWASPLTTVSHKNALLCDLRTGQDRLCSPALLAAIVATASRLHDHETWPKCICAEQDYFGMARLFLKEEATFCNLPYLQALGLLSLLEVDLGNETEARELIISCLDGFIRFFRQEREYYCTTEQDIAITALHSAIALASIIDLASHLSICLSDEADNDQRQLATQIGDDKIKKAIEICTQLSQKLYSRCSLPLVLSQLTIIVRETRLNLDAAKGEAATGVPVGKYIRCLELYSCLLALPEGADSQTCKSSILFSHSICYQFCLLALFRPVVSSDRTYLGLSARAVCLESSQTILALVRSYSHIFTLRYVPTLLPYFTYMAGSTLLALCSHGCSHGCSPGKSISSTEGGGLLTVDRCVGCLMPNTSQVMAAILQLYEMAASHPAAAKAYLTLCTLYASLEREEQKVRPDLDLGYRWEAG
ncbi:hypothetical protein GQ53DRAFT_350379 [Thozetella sp. PMI_491]|nr:hypothetical protein GQ53DRAFT_350379 [Thozetella sp. PMI_491]